MRGRERRGEREREREREREGQHSVMWAIENEWVWGNASLSSNVSYCPVNLTPKAPMHNVTLHGFKSTHSPAPTKRR